MACNWLDSCVNIAFEVSANAFSDRDSKLDGHLVEVAVVSFAARSTLPFVEILHDSCRYH